ncbi:MAG: tetratricopeptide repeat protein [Sphingobacteriaceae bacterium]|nr:tetratricopeptide repeat protein [Sphingobacteriaceae bacterium]
MDSIVTKELHPDNKKILDSILPLYHKSKSDSLKYALLETIVENSADYGFCERYNTLLYNLTKSALTKKNISEEKRKVCSRFYATALIYKGLIYSDKGKVKESLSFYTEALKIFEQLDYKVGIGYALNNIGAYYHRTGELNEAIKNYKRGLKINEDIGDERGVSSLLFNIAGIYDSQGAIQQALEYYNLSIVKFEKIGSTRAVAYCLNNMAAIYKNQHENEKALELIKKCRKVFEKEGDKVGVAFCLNNAGALYRDMGNISLALQYLQESLALGQKIGNKSRVANAAVNIGVLYDGIKRTDSALIYFKEANGLYNELEDKEGLASCLNNIANTYLREGRLTEAEKASLSSLEIGQQVGVPELVKEASESLYNIYKQQKKIDKALSMHELFIQMKDSIQNEKTRKESIRSQFQFEYDLKAVSDSLEFAGIQETKDLKIKVQVAQLEKEETLRLALIFGLILVVVLAILIYRSYKLKSKDNILISSQRDLLEQKNKENEILMNEIHHRIKNNLQIISSLLKLPQQQISTETAKEVMNESRERVLSIAIIHKLLYESDTKKLVDTKKYIAELSGEITKHFSQKNTLEVTTDVESVLMDVDRMVPLGLVINELLLNAIKHAFTNVQKPAIEIKLQKEESNIILKVKDNGIVDISEKIREGGSSFGIKLIYDLAEQMNASVDVFYLNGTNFVLKFKT